MTRRLTALLLCALIALPFAACARTATAQNDRIQIVATLFPQYDFARQIAGDRASVVMLLPAGVESHTFEPKPSDIQTIYRSDLFLYTGDEMEPWAARILEGGGDTTMAVDLSSGIDTLAPLDDDADGHDDHDDHQHAADPHIWLDLRNAAHMAQAITNALCDVDPAGADAYRANTQALVDELLALDAAFETMIAGRTRDAIVFGGRFSYSYFLARYNLPYETAYESCSAAAEPSMRKVSEIIAFVKANSIPAVYHEELSDPTVARTIAQDTGAELLLFSTAHNVTKDELDSGVSFLDIMRRNYDNLKRGLY